MFKKTALIMMLVMCIAPCAFADEPAEVSADNEVSQDAQPDEMTLRENAVNQKAAELDALAQDLAGREANLVQQDKEFAARA